LTRRPPTSTLFPYTRSSDLLVKDPFIADRFLPDGFALKPGERLVQPHYAEALALIAQQGESALHGGPLGNLVHECMERSGAFLRSEEHTSELQSLTNLVCRL